VVCSDKGTALGQRRSASDMGAGQNDLYGVGATRGRVSPARRPGVAHGKPGGDGALSSGPGTDREKLTVGSRVTDNS
jgi:hypothetical protein